MKLCVSILVMHQKLNNLQERRTMMKNYLKIVSFVILFMISGCAGSSRYMIKATPVEGPSPGKAIVYFMRPSGYGFAINFQIWDGDHFIGLSQAKSYFAYECDAGKHLFLGIAENKVALEADLEAGKSYYIGTNVRTGALKARIGFTPVRRGSELWEMTEIYKTKLHFIELKEEEGSKWEAIKKPEIQRIIDYFTTGEGKEQVLTLSKKDGR